MAGQETSGIALRFSTCGSPHSRGATVAVAAIVLKTEFDRRHGSMHHPFVAWITVPVLLILAFTPSHDSPTAWDGFWRGAQSKWPQR